MSHVRRSVAAAGCALLLWLLPAAGQEPATSTKELIAELTGLSSINRGLRAEERLQFGKINREPSHDQPYMPGKVLVSWRPSREPAVRDLTREGVPVQHVERPDHADFVVLRMTTPIPSQSPGALPRAPTWSMRRRHTGCILA